MYLFGRPTLNKLTSDGWTQRNMINSANENLYLTWTMFYNLAHYAVMNIRNRTIYNIHTQQAQDR